MKSKVAIIIGIWIFFLNTSAQAQTMYVTDKIQIMMRRGASTEYKIINKLNSGDAVNVLETQGSWTRIRIPEGMEGMEGWVNTQFLTDQKPGKVELKYLQEEQERLAKDADLLTEDNKKLLAENEELRIRAEESRKKQDEAILAYEQLKTESTDYLTVQSGYEKATAELEKQRQKVMKLEIQLETWKGDMILIGLGVLLFFVGFLLGLANAKSRGKSRSSYLR